LIVAHSSSLITLSKSTSLGSIPPNLIADSGIKAVMYEYFNGCTTLS
jgi:hypothetical protein